MPISGPLALPLGGDAAIGTQTVDHVALALDRLAYQFRDKPNIVGLITQLAAQCASLEKTAADLETLVSIDESSGAQLDNLGAILGEPRIGFDDGVYRLHLKARIWLNRSSATPEDIYSTFRMILDSVTLQLQETPPASFILHVMAQLDSTTAQYLVGIMERAKPAGVWGFLHWLNAAPSGSFCFAGGPGLGLDGGIWSSAES